MKSEAQRRTRRWAFYLSACCLGSSAYAAESGCERLPTHRQAACQEVVRCLAISDAKKSQACLRVASEIPMTEVEIQPTPPPSRVATPSYEEIEVPTEKSTPPKESDKSTPKQRSRFDIFRRDREENDEPRRWRIFKRDAKPEKPVTTATVERSVLTIPARYTGEVSALRNLVRDRQLIALDDQLLFEAERAPGGKLKLGDRVKVIRISSFLGNRFQLTGPNRRPVNSYRIQCERVQEELSPQTRSRCLMLDRPDGPKNN